MAKKATTKQTTNETNKGPMVDFDALTLADIEDFEDISGVSFEELTSGQMPARALSALVWITKRRDNPDITLEDVRQMKLSELNAVMEDEAPNAEEESA